MTFRRVASLAPWALATLAGVLFVVLLGPTGILYNVGWGLVLAAGRAVASGPRSQRLAVDALLAVVAFLGAYVGGWYLLPAIGLFALADAAEVEVPAVRPRLEVGPLAAIGSFLAGLAAVAFLALGSTYASRRSTVGPAGVVAEDPQISLTFLDVNGLRGAVILAVVVALVVAVLAGSLLDRSGEARLGRPLLAVGAVGLAGVAVVSASTIGPVLAPAALLGLIALAWATWWRSSRRA